jgi:proteasome lid subunit RPN8/RPN11
MEFKEQTKAYIKAHALKTRPNECCGFIVEKDGEELVVGCKNTATNPKEDFRISALAYLHTTRLGQIKASYHSHDEIASPSTPDIMNSEAEKLTHVIYVVSTDSFVIYEPKGYNTKYTVRIYKLGENDCLTLAIDYYRRELGISIEDPFKGRGNDFFRVSQDSIWASQQYLNEITKAGFKLVTKESELKLHDCILTCFYNSEHPSHILIYLGNNKVLHQPRDGVSLVEDYSDYFKQKTYGVARYVK